MRNKNEFVKTNRLINIFIVVIFQAGFYAILRFEKNFQDASYAVKDFARYKKNMDL